MTVGLLDRFRDPADPLVAALVDTARVGIMVCDREGWIVRANQPMQRLVGYGAELAAGSRMPAVLQATDGPGCAEICAAFDAGRPLAPFLLHLPPTDNERDRAAEVSVSPLCESDGSVVGLLLRFADVSSRRKMEAQLAQGQRLQAVGQLAGGIAHDFNNLLQAMMGAADEVLAHPTLDAVVRADVLQIRSSGQRGARLVQQLLAFGRRQALHPQVVGINGAVTDLSGLLQRLLGSSIAVRLELGEPAPNVLVDPGQLDQVLVNLAVNARDAMPEGGLLTLRTGHITLFRPLAQQAETIPAGRYVMVEVQDTGSGIPPEVLPRIFEPFFSTRRGPDATPGRSGTGLGLSTVHGIVRQSDGFIAVDSQVGRGTQMRVYLPRHDGAPANVSPVACPAAVPSATGARGTVLLVDDEEAVRRLVARALARAGWTVLSAGTGEEALALLDEEGGGDVRVLVSDVMMPGMDGAELLATVRRQRPLLPAVLVSGYSEDALRGELDQAHTRFLGKPYAIAELVSAISELSQP